MKQLRLEPDTLRVESFDPGHGASVGGTVHAREESIACPVGGCSVVPCRYETESCPPCSQACQHETESCGGVSLACPVPDTRDDVVC